VVERGRVNEPRAIAWIPATLVCSPGMLIESAMLVRAKKS